MKTRSYESFTRSLIAVLAILMMGLAALSQGGVTVDQSNSKPAVTLPSVATLEDAYLGLSMGPLKQATLVTLPKGILLRAGKTDITEEQLTAEMVKVPKEMLERVQMNAFFMVENMAVRSLLLAEAHTWAAKTKRNIKSDTAETLTKSYLQSMVADLSVTDAEIRGFYDANPDVVGGAAYSVVANDLRGYVLEQKRQDAVQAHIGSLSERMVIEVDAEWAKLQAAVMFDNPVDQARRSGKPSVIDFGRGGCLPCDLMTPILEELSKTYADQCNVLFCHVGDNPLIAARYSISSIPVQVFFNKDGKEVFRHVGFFPKSQMLAKLAELGVKQ